MATVLNSKLISLFKQRQSEALHEAAQIKKYFFQKQIRVLGVGSSMRQPIDCPAEDSTTEWLLKQCLNEAKRLGAKTKHIELRDYDIKPCKGCYSTTNTQCHFKCTCYPEDDMTKELYDLISWADVIIFATPVHSFAMSSLMKLFIDRMISMDGSLAPANPADPKNKEINIAHTKFIQTTANEKFGSGFLRRLTGKIAGIIVSGHEVGASMAISSLFMTLNHYGMIFPPFSTMYAINTICEPTYKDKQKLRIKCHIDEARRLARNLITAAKIAKRKPDYWWVYDSRTN